MNDINGGCLVDEQAMQRIDEHRMRCYIDIESSRVHHEKSGVFALRLVRPKIHKQFRMYMTKPELDKIRSSGYHMISKGHFAILSHTSRPF